MEKLNLVDFTVTKKITKNIGNYSSVAPAVSLTFKDVPLEKVKKLHEMMNDTLTSMLTLETVSLMGLTEADLKKKDLEEIADNAEKSCEESLKTIEEFLKV